MRTILILFFTSFVYACSPESSSNMTSENSSDQLTIQSLSLKPNEKTERWYTLAIVTEGEEIFNEYCASCHGKKAESTKLWKTVDKNGNYPPPPLNGTAHAWHHSLAIMDQVIRAGGKPLGGVMPAWEGILSEGQRLKAIASFQQYWSDEVYERWLERELAFRDSRQN